MSAYPYGGYSHPDGCAGCQRAVRTVPLTLRWWQNTPFPLRLCVRCILGLLVAFSRRRR